MFVLAKFDRERCCLNAGGVMKMAELLGSEREGSNWANRLVRPSTRETNLLVHLIGN